ncbi:ImmA/IrrE family metallo-endopeptidase [Ilumatobacter sp.]|uniref:ImmA/IrrE family metallo-endopeptidase n=1 Tax=Ilumatobacter sp. TaxID=1967498 RepID=UPI00374FF1BA
MTVRVEVSPEVLRWARTRSGIDDETWTIRFKDYDAWVNGDKTPTVKQLQSFATRAYAPFGQLLLAEPPQEEVPIPDFRTVGNRPVAQPTADLLDVIYQCQRRQDWYRTNQLILGADELSFVGSLTTETPIAEAAGELRQLLDWTGETRAELRSWDGAVTRLRENAESAGVLVMISGIVGSNTHRKLNPADFRGFALVDPHASIVFVNGADSKSAQLFTLAHELAHVMLGSTALSDLTGESIQTNDTELWCNQVAAELLVPMGEFRSRFDPLLDLREQLQALAEVFRVSTQVILGQIRAGGWIDWGRYLEELRLERTRVAGLVSATASTGGNFYNSKPVQVSKRFARELIASTFESRTAYTEAFRLLDVSKSETFHGLSTQLGVA